MRPKPERTRPESFQLLRERLRAAKAHFESGGTGGRQGAIEALNAVAEFLVSFEDFEQEGLAQPVLSVSVALTDADDGIPSQILHVKRKGGRKPESTGRKGVRAYSALTVDLLMKTGLTRREAAKRTAAKLKLFGVRKQGGGGPDITPETVLAWRDSIKADLGTTFAAEIYEEMLKRLPSADNSDSAAKSALRRDVLKRLESVLRQVRANDA